MMNHNMFRALFRALLQYPKRNPHQLQAAKVCAGVLKLANEIRGEDMSRTALDDAKDFGLGIEIDGVRIPPERVSVLSKTQIGQRDGWINVDEQVPKAGQRIIGRTANWRMWEEVWNADEPMGKMVAWIPFPDNASAIALAQAGVAMEVQTLPTMDGRTIAVLVPATRNEHRVFKSVEELASWLETFYEANEDGAISGNKWKPAQLAAYYLRINQFKNNLIVLDMPELIVDTSPNNEPGQQTEYTLSRDEAESAVEQLIRNNEDQLNQIAWNIVERKRTAR